jgi:N-dimethylarginine dimethylaminohydrolase
MTTILAVNAKSFLIQQSQNVYTEAYDIVDRPKALEQHASLCKAVGARVLQPPDENLPDLVFLANSGLFLPRLPEKVVLLSNMKYASRARETDWIEQKFNTLKIKTIRFPSTNFFEGQGECVWMHNGRVLLFGYGYRSTAGTVKTLQRVLNRIYEAYGVEPPFVLALKLSRPNFYHLDLALLAISPTTCIVQDEAISNLKKLQKYVAVHVLKTSDRFVLNSVVLPDKVVTHQLKNMRDRRFLEKYAQRPVVEVNVSEFEKSGGSVACLLFKMATP